MKKQNPLAFSLPWPPSVNRYWRHGRGRVYLAPAGRQFIELVRNAIPMFHDAWETERVFLEVEAYPPDRRRRDIDNILKALLDGLEKGSVFRDDSQVKKLRVEMLEPIKGGKLDIKVGTIEP